MAHTPDTWSSPEPRWWMTHSYPSQTRGSGSGSCEREKRVRRVDMNHACVSAFGIAWYLPAKWKCSICQRENLLMCLMLTVTQSLTSVAMIMDFASSFWFSRGLYFLWAGNAWKSMRRRMTNVLTLALRDLKGSTSLNPSKKRKMAKKTCLTLGSARNRKRCFRSCELEWPATSSQRSVQEC